MERYRGMAIPHLPVVVVDACGYGHHEAAHRSLAQLAFFGGSLHTDTATLCALLTADTRVM